jgi:hypothetical protein
MKAVDLRFLEHLLLDEKESSCYFSWFTYSSSVFFLS